MKTYGGVDVLISVFLTSALVGNEWSATRPCRFTPGGRVPCTPWIRCWVGLRADQRHPGSRWLCFFISSTQSHYRRLILLLILDGIKNPHHLNLTHATGYKHPSLRHVGCFKTSFTTLKAVLLVWQKHVYEQMYECSLSGHFQGHCCHVCFS
jgi:hypothetical protein